MAYIDPEGMFGGDRMAMLSDAAKMAWPWLWCASNTVGRVELNYRTIVDTVFRQFKKPPAEGHFWEWVSEFHESWLMFVYQAEDGKVWGQWFVSEKYLPTYKIRADQKTPAPNAGEFLAWQKRYAEHKQNAVSGKCRVLSISKKDQNISKDLGPSSILGGEIEIEIEIEERSKASSAADAAGATEESLISVTAERMVSRHPRKRRCSGEEVKTRLRAILKPLPREDRASKLGQIDANHQGWCESDQWTKEDGEYAKGLDNWLAPTKRRYEIQPPPRAAPGLFEEHPTRERSFVTDVARIVSRNMAEKGTPFA